LLTLTWKCKPRRTSAGSRPWPTMRDWELTCSLTERSLRHTAAARHTVRDIISPVAGAGHRAGPPSKSRRTRARPSDARRRSLIGMSELVRVVTPARRSPSSASDTASVSSAQSPSRTAARRAVIKSHPHRRLSRPRPRQAGNPAVYLCIVSAWPHRPLLPLQVRLMISTWRHSEMAEPYRHSRRSVDPVAG
jgi:hypothetical protein